VDAEIVRGVHPVRRGHRRQVKVLERAEVTEVEYRAEVDVEALEPLAGEHGVAGADLVHRLGREARVVRRRGRPDVARRARETPSEHLTVTVLHPGDGVELAPVPVGAVE
jgi:hypothetical protein